MGYSSRTGRRPFEYASKSAHGHLIADKAVQDFLKGCQLPKQAADVDIAQHDCEAFKPVKPNPVKLVLAFDGGYQEVAVRDNFPSATVCFFQFGALMFKATDL